MTPERLSEIVNDLLIEQGSTLSRGRKRELRHKLFNTIPELIAEVRRLQELALNIGDAEKLLAIEQENRNLTAEVRRLQAKLDAVRVATTDWVEHADALDAALNLPAPCPEIESYRSVTKKLLAILDGETEGGL